MKKAERIYKQLSLQAKNDPNILGFILSGSRGKGIATKHSDYDIYIIIKDSVVQQYKRKFTDINNKDIDLRIFSMSEFYNHAK